MPNDDQNQSEESHIRQIVEETLEQKLRQQAAIDLDTPEGKIQKCVIDCTNAHNLCLQAMNYSLELGGNYSDPVNFGKLQDCSEFCELTIGFLERKSYFFRATVSLCVQICEQTVDYCRKFEDDQFKACADYVKMAAESCRDLE